MKSIKIFLTLLILLVVLYFVGPRYSFEPVEQGTVSLDLSLADLASFIENREATVEGIKPDNEARIIWADSVRKTDYSLVYLHGFSASPMEGNPIHFETAERYGMNLYLHRSLPL